MALQRTRRPRIRSGRSLRSPGSPLNALNYAIYLRNLIAPLLAAVRGVSPGEPGVTVPAQALDAAVAIGTATVVAAAARGDRLVKAGPPHVRVQRT
jgi:hypothetical protein